MATKKLSKMEKARRVMTKFADLPRAKVLAKLTGKSVGLSEKGAASYYTRLRHEIDGTEPAHREAE